LTKPGRFHLTKSNAFGGLEVGHVWGTPELPAASGTAENCQGHEEREIRNSALPELPTSLGRESCARKVLLPQFCIPSPADNRLFARLWAEVHAAALRLGVPDAGPYGSSLHTNWRIAQHEAGTARPKSVRYCRVSKNFGGPRARRDGNTRRKPVFGSLAGPGFAGRRTIQAGFQPQTTGRQHRRYRRVVY
jgi:hypothetical protein